MDEPKSNDHQDHPKTENNTSDDVGTSEAIVQNMEGSPREEATDNPQTHSPNQETPSHFSKIAEAIIDWLRHYWEKPREKSKWTDIGMLVLTLAIAVAAFWSACVFQGQLTEGRKTTEIAIGTFYAQTRPWVGFDSAKIGKKSTILLQVTNYGVTPARRIVGRAFWFDNERRQYWKQAEAPHEVDWGLKYNICVEAETESVAYKPPYVGSYRIGIAFPKKSMPIDVPVETTFSTAGSGYIAICVAYQGSQDAPMADKTDSNSLAIPGTFHTQALYRVNGNVMSLIDADAFDPFHFRP